MKAHYQSACGQKHYALLTHWAYKFGTPIWNLTKDQIATAKAAQKKADDDRKAWIANARMERAETAARLASTVCPACGKRPDNKARYEDEFKFFWGHCSRECAVKTRSEWWVRRQEGAESIERKLEHIQDVLGHGGHSVSSKFLAQALETLTGEPFLWKRKHLPEIKDGQGHHSGEQSWEDTTDWTKAECSDEMKAQRTFADGMVFRKYTDVVLRNLDDSEVHAVERDIRWGERCRWLTESPTFQGETTADFLARGGKIQKIVEGYAPVCDHRTKGHRIKHRKPLKIKPCFLVSA